ncbi:MAG: hypothetical protein RSA45_07645 [Hydrogenoanaerobacterium sp.]
MENNKCAVDFFLGANTPQGFVSKFEEIADPAAGWQKFIIKGGPGTGKSGIIKAVAGAVAGKCDSLELIHCSSDVDSLDAVIANDIKVVVADGTAPHAIEPKYPGAYETTVNLCDCWDEEKLQENRIHIMELYTKTARYHERCCRFLAAAGSLLNDSYRIAAEYTDAVKVAGYAERLAQREFGTAKAAVRGKESVRFLSAVTNEGITAFKKTPSSLCERLYIIDDDCGAVSRLLLSDLRSYALEGGFSVISCYCVSSPYEKLEHLLIPQLGIGFLTSNRYHHFGMPYYRNIHSKRFMDTEGIRQKKQRLSFNRKAANELLGEASRLLEEGKTSHDQLESCYTPYVDFAKVDKKAKAVIEKICSFGSNT